MYYLSRAKVILVYQHNSRRLHIDIIDHNVHVFVWIPNSSRTIFLEITLMFVKYNSINSAI